MLKSGHRIVPVTGKEQDELVKDFKISAVGTIRLDPGGWFYTSPFILYADKLYDFMFKPSDVLVMTFPKAGTTWTQEIVWTMMNNPDLDNPAASLPVVERSPHIEMDFMIDGTNFPDLGPELDFKEKFKRSFPDKDVRDGVILQILEVIPDPRTIKTHLPLSLFNPKLLETCKVIYVARNPKDVAVSYHHLMRLFTAHGFNGTLEETVNYLIMDKVIWSPYWLHMKEAWDLRHHPNLHFVFYEAMKEDPKSEIVKIQKFLNVELTEEQINNIVQYTSFGAMKERDNMFGDVLKEASNFCNAKHMQKEGGFFRKGTVGDWQNRLTANQAKMIDEWTKKNVKDFGPDFRYRTDKNADEILNEIGANHNN